MFVSDVECCSAVAGGARMIPGIRNALSCVQPCGFSLVDFSVSSVSIQKMRPAAVGLTFKSDSHCMRPDQWPSRPFWHLRRRTLRNKLKLALNARRVQCEPGVTAALK